MGASSFLLVDHGLQELGSKLLPVSQVLPQILAFTLPADDVLIFKICDFGISKDFKNITKETVGDQIFSPFYAAPEQIAKKITESPFLVDSWAIGIIFYQLITGKEHPYQKEEEEKDFEPKNQIDSTSTIDYDYEFFNKYPNIESIVKLLL